MVEQRRRDKQLLIEQHAPQRQDPRDPPKAYTMIEGRQHEAFGAGKQRKG